MNINIHAGHNQAGKVACGAVGIIDESKEARNVKNKLIKLLKESHNVKDCTVNNGTSARDVLEKIVKKCNTNNADLDISIHFNAGANDKKGNGASAGCEVLIKNEKLREQAEKICKSISKLGFRNRGVKVRNDLYFLNRTKAPALLIECCFVDDKDDCKIYNADKMAKAIAEAIEKENKEGYKAKVTAERLNVRKKASKSSDVVKVIKKGDIIEITEEVNNWGKINDGYVHIDYIKRV